MNTKKHSLDQLLAMNNKFAAELDNRPRSLPELNKLIIGWAGDRGILTGSTPADQFKKTAEELGELITALALDDHDEIADAIGDIYVTLVIGAEIKGLNHSINFQAHYWNHDLAHLLKCVCAFRADDRFHTYRMAMTSLNGVCRSLAMDLTDCVNLAWDQIKDRKGKLIDGMFVKEADL